MSGGGSRAASSGGSRPGGGMGSRARAGSSGNGCAERPSCADILRLTCGECSFGFGLALCRFLDRRELNIMVHPSTVHLCISRRCTAEK